MKVNLTHKNEVTIQIKVALSQEDLEPSIAKTYNLLRPKVKVAGFRPGKAPDSVVQKELGANLVQAEVAETAVQDAYIKVLDEHNLNPVAAPQISLTKYVPYTELEYEAEVEILPPVKLGDWQKIRMKAPSVEVKDSEVQDVVLAMQQRYAQYKKVERAAKIGDRATISYKGTSGGKPIDGGSAENQSVILGDSNFIPGFEDNIVGLKADATKKFKIKFPKDYHNKALADAQAEFEITLHKVEEVTLPDLTPEQVKKMGPFTNEAELRNGIKNQLSRDKQDRAEVEYEVELIDKIAEKSEIHIPPVLIREQIERLEHELADQLGGSGLDMEKYLAMRKLTAEDLKKELEPEATRRVKRSLVLSAIAQAQEVKLGADELQTEIELLKGRYQDAKIQAELDTEDVRKEVGSQLLARKVIANIKQSAGQ